MKKKPWMRKGRRVLALLRPGTIFRTRCYTINHERFIYLFEVKIDDDGVVGKYHPQDVEELSNEKL